PATHIRSLKTAWHNALRRAGLVPLPLYNCRHSFATRLAGAGVSDTIIDQLLGHSRRDILRFYTGRVSEYLRDAINRLEQFRAMKGVWRANPQSRTPNDWEKCPRWCSRSLQQTLNHITIQGK